MNPNRRHLGRQLGVSLIEALVALAVMAIGMLGIVGVQSTLRANSDVAKQRSEALRLAQREVEGWRSFVVLGSTGTSPPGYADIASGAASAAGVNAEYTITRTVTSLAAPRTGKTLKVQVSWTDRTNNSAQQVQLSSVIAGIAPELGATMVVGGDGDFSGQLPKGRNRGIPLSAKDLGNGTSGFIPPGATGVAWVFSNATGLIRLCTTTATTTAGLDTTNITCGTDYALLLSGFVHYSLGPGPMVTPSATNFDSLPMEAANLTPFVHQTQPTSLATNRPCYTATYDALSLAYYCAVPVLQIVGTTPAWSGDLRFIYLPASSHPRIANNVNDDDERDRKVCRFHATGTYTAETRSRLNQNYLVIRAGDDHSPYSCPSPTLAHQPVP